MAGISIKVSRVVVWDAMMKKGKKYKEVVGILKIALIA